MYKIQIERSAQARCFDFLMPLSLFLVTFVSLLPLYLVARSVWTAFLCDMAGIKLLFRPIISIFMVKTCSRVALEPSRRFSEEPKEAEKLILLERLSRKKTKHTQMWTGCPHTYGHVTDLFVMTVTLTFDPETADALWRRSSVTFCALKCLNVCRLRPADFSRPFLFSSHIPALTTLHTHSFCMKALFTLPSQTPV